MMSFPIPSAHFPKGIQFLFFFLLVSSSLLLPTPIPFSLDAHVRTNQSINQSRFSWSVLNFTRRRDVKMGGFVLLGRDATDNFFFFQKIFFQNKRGCRRVASLFQRRNHPE